MRKGVWKALLMLAMAACLAGTGGAQVLVSPESAAKAQSSLEKIRANTMKCQVKRLPARLGFSMRFHAGYVLSLPLLEFGGKAGTLGIFSRVTPVGGNPALFAEYFEIPELSQKFLAGAKDRKLEMSGFIALGQGKYRLEFVAIGSNNHACRQEWDIEAGSPKDQASLPLALKPGAMMGGGTAAWDGKLDTTSSGVRATILLDAAPMYPRATRLRAWDRSFLLGTLISLLQQLPCSSVRLIAVNLEQRKEIFRAEPFGPQEFKALAGALQAMEVVTVTAGALQRHSAPVFLAGLMEQEASAEPPSDVVIWLGPNALSNEKLPASILPAIKPSGPKFVYFEFFPGPGGFPDSIHHLTKALHGKVVPMRTANDLGKGIHELLEELGQNKR